MFGCSVADFTPAQTNSTKEETTPQTVQTGPDCSGVKRGVEMIIFFVYLRLHLTVHRFTTQSSTSSCSRGILQQGAYQVSKVLGCRNSRENWAKFSNETSRADILVWFYTLVPPGRWQNSGKKRQDVLRSSFCLASN